MVLYMPQVVADAGIVLW